MLLNVLNEWTGVSRSNSERIERRLLRTEILGLQGGGSNSERIESLGLRRHIQAAEDLAATQKELKGDSFQGPQLPHHHGSNSERIER